MESIIKEGNITTVFVIMKVNNETDQEDLYNLLSDDIDKRISKLDGFVSANLHKSIDGKTIVNYGQWETVEHYKKFIEIKSTSSQIEKVTKLVISRESILSNPVKIYHK